MTFTVIIFLFGVLVHHISGHGMMIDPPNRSSLWRFDNISPINYEDNQNFCGGFNVQWNVYGGKCGVCGDVYGDRVPRSNENTGMYGKGVIVAKYPPGSVIDVNIILTANHMGQFTYSLCKLENITKPENDSCFAPLLFEDGSKSFNVESNLYKAMNKIQLPKNFTCEHCVLRWNYETGNSWGLCASGEGAIGCGPQETFRSCSDISIKE